MSPLRANVQEDTVNLLLYPFFYFAWYTVTNPMFVTGIFLVVTLIEVRRDG